MLQATLADLRKPSAFFDTTQVIRIINGRKKEAIGYFVPKALKSEFESFLSAMEKERKSTLLKRVARAAAKDPVAEGGVGDGL